MRLAIGFALAVLAAGPAVARDAHDCKDHVGIAPDARWPPSKVPHEKLCPAATKAP